MRFVLHVISCAVMVAGCGPRNGRQPITGTVTWQGRPVPAGQILFEPDAEAGNSGPGGVASIREGVFATDAEFGAVAGPHRVRFRLGDGKNVSALFPFGEPLTRDEPMAEVTIPATGGSFDFALPRK